MAAGMYLSYRLIKTQRQMAHVKNILAGSQQAVESMNSHFDRLYDFSMVFLHHSVGHGFLYEGGLQDSLLGLGIVVRGATQGSTLGQQTDICDWVPKFRDNLSQILTFRAHPDKFFDDDRKNDIVMFKSCFPNSGITGDGGDNPDFASRERTTANFKAAFAEMQNQLASESGTLFVYMTAPPLVPEETTPEQAARAIAFNKWVIGEYLPSYREATGLDNLAVYDLYSFLADESGFLRKEYRPDWPNDSHPNKNANVAVAADFIKYFAPIWEDWKASHFFTTS